MMSRCTLCLALVLVLPAADATRKATKVATPPWACPVTKCSTKAVQEDIADAQPDIDGNSRKALLALRGAVQEQVLCPFGGDDPNAKKASKAEVKSFFDGFAAAYDKLKGIKSDTKQEEKAAVKEEVAPAVSVASVPGTVQKVDKQSFMKLVDEHNEDLLVVFYAPWCPHCQAFVLAEQAPLDQLAKELHAANGPKVLSFDTTASAIPMGFNVNLIPTILKVTKDGRRSEFKEDPTQIEHLKAFALGN